MILFGELPTATELSNFTKRIKENNFVHSDVYSMMSAFTYDAHPMGILCSTIAGLSTLHPEQNPSLVGEGVYKNRKIRNKQIYKILGNVPTIAANSYRHRIGRDFNLPSEELGYV